MENENLYQSVKNKICDEIFLGRYRDGGMLPSERELERILEVSRVTVRRSLKLLEEDGLIVREVGRGTRITFSNSGHPAELDMTVLIAPAKNPFFSEFIAAFQQYAQQRGTLVLYVEKPESEGIESCLYRLYKRGLRNAVVWLEELQADREKLQRLRAIGMNMVFFDSDQGMPYADCAVLDNAAAVTKLYQGLQQRGCAQIGYAGWDLPEAYSVRERENAYLTLCGSEEWLLRFSWQEKRQAAETAERFAVRAAEQGVQAVLCSDRECGGFLCEAVQKQNVPLLLAAVDELPAGRKECVLVYRQDLQQTVAQIYRCLETQCSGSGKWSASVCKIPGTLLER